MAQDQSATGLGLSTPPAGVGLNGKRTTPQGIGLDDATPNHFQRWYQSLPQEQKFSQTVIPEHLIPTYEQWKKDTGLYEKSPDYDLKGWFMSQLAQGGGRGTATQMVRNPDGSITPHTGSVGLNGKQLKSPFYQTFHMSALNEIIRKAGIDENQINWDGIATEKDSLNELDRLMKLHKKNIYDIVPNVKAKH